MGCGTVTGAVSKLLVFTDLHLLEPGEDIIGLDPAARFAEGLAHALERHPDAARLVLMGDLTHHGKGAQYRVLADLLAQCPLPVSYMLGNHDNRRVFLREFPDAAQTQGGHVQEMVDLGASVLITLDTFETDPKPRHSGRLCAERLAWLSRALSWAEGRPVLIALHHPPIMTGFSGMDAIALNTQDAAALRKLLLDYSGEVHLICGHIHRTISGQEKGLSFTILKSPCHQQPMTLGVAGSEQSVDEPGAYGIVLASDNGFVIHSEDFVIAQAASVMRDEASQ